MESSRDLFIRCALIGSIWAEQIVGILVYAGLALFGLNDSITVLIPEFEPKRFWHRFLHNQTGLYLRTYFHLKYDVVISVVPFKLRK